MGLHVFSVPALLFGIMNAFGPVWDVPLSAAVVLDISTHGLSKFPQTVWALRRIQLESISIDSICKY
jgi:hypothetical protein